MVILLTLVSLYRLAVILLYVKLTGIKRFDSLYRLLWGKNSFHSEDIVLNKSFS